MIERNIHLVWPSKDGKPLPQLYKQHMQMWKELNPSFHVHLWDGTEFPEARMWRPESANWSMPTCSDEIRYRAVHSMGGFYFDLDIEPIHPIPEWMVEAGGFLHEVEPGMVVPTTFGEAEGGPVFGWVLEQVEQARQNRVGKVNLGTKLTRPAARFKHMIRLPKSYWLSNTREEALYGIHPVKPSALRPPASDAEADPANEKPGERGCCDPPKDS